MDGETPPLVEQFIARWRGREGGQERANYALYLSELCDVLGVARPDPAAATARFNDYVFERAVTSLDGFGAPSNRRIDLYKRDCFILEAKQSRQPGGAKHLPDPPSPPPAPTKASPPLRRGSADRSWDVLMMNARRQAENYARALPSDHAWPPYILVVDVGRCIEVYADFSGQGRNYTQFPDRQGFRIYLEDLRRPDLRERLRCVWTDPQALNPALRTARVTRDIAERLAAVSKALEGAHAPESVAMFLMRCLFTMFAEDVGLLPPKSFADLLKRCEANPDIFPHTVEQLWGAMDSGGFAHGVEAVVKRFNGEFFKRRAALKLGRAEIGELRRAAAADWREVEPAIFGALLEHALDPAERRRLGAHYTPRAYVERLVVATVIEPLRADWAVALSTAERQKQDGRGDDAIATLRAFHDQLCAIRILDPACGAGNFLYVALELIKRLEGEVLESLLDVGGQEALSGLEGHTVDPRQFLGLEVNPRAAAITELVLWIGYLQWHFRTKGSAPAEPILRAFGNIKVSDAVLSADRTLARDALGRPLTRIGPDGEAREIDAYSRPRRPDWPPAEFIIGNPPFIGGKDLRARLGDGYAEALWAAHPKMNRGADFVMYWWDHAAELLTAKGSKLRRFGLVTTNSIGQVFQRRAVLRHLQAKRPISLILAIPDHPWTKATREAAAVRIAMTVAVAGRRAGVLRLVTREAALDTDQPVVELDQQAGLINADLTIGADVSGVDGLRANAGLCSPGVKLHGAGFIVTPQQAARLGLGRRPGLERRIRLYRNGRDLTARPRHVMVIDLFGLEAAAVRARFPEIYQHLLATVKPERQKQYDRSPTTDAAAYLDQWWLMGKPRSELRPALDGLRRYIATVETAKHRVFQFLDADITPDNKLIIICSDDSYLLGVVSARSHTAYALAAGGWLGVGNDPCYSKSRCFDPFPFPDATEPQKTAIRALAEELDAHRKQRLAAHPALTLTGLYNVLTMLRAGDAPAALGPGDRAIFEDGLVLILRELHDRLDAAVAAAYGWPADLPDPELLDRLVALNRARAAEEARGRVRWLRPEHQAARFGSPAERQLEAGLAAPTAKAAKPAFPRDDRDQTAAVVAALHAAAGPLDAAAIAAGFRSDQRVARQVAAVLAALARIGVIASGEGGRGFILPRAA